MDVSDSPDGPKFSSTSLNVRSLSHSFESAERMISASTSASGGTLRTSIVRCL